MLPAEISANLRRWCAKHECTQALTSWYSPQQNGRAEHFNRSLQSCVRAMLVMAGLPDSCWAEEFCAAAHVLNRTCDGGNDSMAPNERLCGERPNVAHLRVFGLLR
jgi:hypothetical protein